MNASSETIVAKKKKKQNVTYCQNMLFDSFMLRNLFMDWLFLQKKGIKRSFYWPHSLTTKAPPKTPGWDSGLQAWSEFTVNFRFFSGWSSEIIWHRWLSFCCSMQSERKTKRHILFISLKPFVKIQLTSRLSSALDTLILFIDEQPSMRFNWWTQKKPKHPTPLLTWLISGLSTRIKGNQLIASYKADQ